MKVRVVLTVDCEDPEIRRSLEAVLAPDNEGAPESLRMEVSGRGSMLAVQLESESFSTSISTALAILADAALFQEVWLLSRPRRG